MEKTVHTMADGTIIPISEMGDRHLINTIRMITRKSQEGFNVPYRIAGLHGGGDAEEWEEVWETVFLQGHRAQKFLGLDSYVKEARSRKLIF